MSLKGWQCRKRALGFRPRVKAKASVAHAPDTRWSTDIARVWCGEQDRWAALEDALLTCYGVIGKATPGLQLRSDNGMVERLIRTIKEQCIWMHNFTSIHEARTAIGKWLEFYNTERPHLALNMKTPAKASELVA